MSTGDVAKDPRFKNVMFDSSSVAAYLRDYHRALGEALAQVDGAALERAHQVMIEAKRLGRTIYTCGNGGSAAIADHLGCDWMKGTRGLDGSTLRVVSLVANMPLVSALANDFSYAQVFAMQLEMQARAGDVLVLISSSGNSANIVEAAGKAKGMGVTTIGMTGFDGGKLAEMADIVLHTPVRNYGVVEDAHQTMMHVLAQTLVGTGGS